MKIIRTQLNHLKDLLPLFDAYRQFYKQKEDLKGAEQFLKERIENKESLIFMAYENDKATGFVQLFPIFSSVSMEPVYLLNDLFVDKNFRGKGIGQALIQKSKDLCISKNYKGLALQTETTNPAQKLYEYLDFIKDPDLHYFWSNPSRK